MKTGDLIFVYGTLRSGEGNGLDKSMLVSRVGEDKINGMLYHLGGFPGLIDTSAEFFPDLPIVVGEVYRIRDASIIPALDAYEGYPSLYGRSEVMSEQGRKVWVYTYNHTPGERAFPIRSGDWKVGKFAKRDAGAAAASLTVAMGEMG